MDVPSTNLLSVIVYLFIHCRRHPIFCLVLLDLKRPFLSTFPLKDIFGIFHLS